MAGPYVHHARVEEDVHPLTAYNQTPTISASLEVEQLAKFSPDLLNTIVHYARPRAICQIEGYRYRIMRDNRQEYCFYLPHLVLNFIMDIPKTFAAIASFLDAQNLSCRVRFEYGVGQYDIESLTIERMGQGIFIELYGVWSSFSLCLETNIYYDAICTMLRDIKKRLEGAQRPT